MSYTISQLKDDLNGVLHGTSTNKVKNINSLFRRAANEVLNEIDPAETRRSAIIGVGLFDGVYDYSPPSDLKGDKIIDIRPQVDRKVADNYSRTFNEQFDINKKNQDFTIESDNASKKLRISKTLTGSILLNNLDTTTSNGTWTAEGGGSNIGNTTIYKAEGSGSVKFDIGAAGGAIVNSTMTQVDLTDHKNKSSIFAWLYLPDSTIITNVIIRWGNDSAKYFSATAAAPHYGSFRNGWNLIKVNWNGAAETGVVDVSKIDYLRVFVTSTSADTDLFVDAIYSKLPSIYECLYYSKFLFRDSATSWAETVTNDDTIINLDVDSYPIYLNKVGMLISQQLSGADSVSDYNFFNNEYKIASQRYKQMYPSEVAKKQTTYWE